MTDRLGVQISSRRQPRQARSAILDAAVSAPAQEGVQRLRRRRLLATLALPLLQGCAPSLAPLSTEATTQDAQALLLESASAHGLAAFSALSDLSVSYAGDWHWLAGKLQPTLVDAGFRGGSQERLLLRDGLVAQAHSGPSGSKQVVRKSIPGAQGDVRVWFNGEESQDGERRAAAALVADGYSLFLLGPMLLAGRVPLAMQIAGAAQVDLFSCDVVRVHLAPGLGFSASDEIALFIDRVSRVMRRVRFTVNGLDSTRGAVAEVDTFDHVAKHGVLWPTGFRERLLRPLPLAVHDWRLTGLDIDRGLDVSEVSSANFAGRAVASAAPLPNG